jgi:hypothetical protein
MNNAVNVSSRKITVLTNMRVVIKSVAFFALTLSIMVTATPAVDAQSAISEETKKKMYQFDPAGAFSEGQDRKKDGQRRGRAQRNSPPVRSVTPIEQLKSQTNDQKQVSHPSVETASAPALRVEAHTSSTPKVNSRATTSTEGRQITGMALVMVLTLILIVLVAIAVLVVKLLREYERVKAENGQNSSRDLASIAPK